MDTDERMTKLVMMELRIDELCGDIWRMQARPDVNKGDLEEMKKELEDLERRCMNLYDFKG